MPNYPQPRRSDGSPHPHPRCLQPAVTADKHRGLLIPTTAHCNLELTADSASQSEGDEAKTLSQLTEMKFIWTALDQRSAGSTRREVQPRSTMCSENQRVHFLPNTAWLQLFPLPTVWQKQVFDVKYLKTRAGTPE